MRAIQHHNMFRDNTPSPKDRHLYDDQRSYTLVVDLEEYGFWKDLIVQTEFSKIFKLEFDLEIGISILHPVDHFNRKVGLKTALSNMQTVKAKLKKIEIQSSGDIQLRFDLYDTPIFILMGVSGNRAIIMRHHSFSILELFSDIFGR
jgi:hypothetical protein